VSPSDAGAASGLVSTMQQVGGALGVAIVGILFFGALGLAGTATSDARAYADAFTVALIYEISAAAAVTVLLICLPAAASPERISRSSP
jgi:hypothetical protein